MVRRRRVELTAIASLDAEIARARQRCEDHVQQACDRLLQRRATKGNAHDLYLESLRSFYEAALAADPVDASNWPSTRQQAFLGRYFPMYQETDAFARFSAALETAGAQWEDSGSGCLSERIKSFEVLKHALRIDTRARMTERDACALEEPVESFPNPDHGTQEELALPRLAPAFNLSRPPHTTVRPPSAESPRASMSAVRVSERDMSLLGLDEDDGSDNNGSYSVPTNSVIVPAEFTTEVVKKSQNWFGRWRTRHLTLRWNELEIRKKSGVSSSSSNRQGLARSFPSQPVMPTSTAPSTTWTAQSSASAAAINSKRYAFQDLISVELIQLDESDPSRKHAIDLHFKQLSANGRSHRTKSLILASENGVDMLKKVRMLIATLALFCSLLAGEKPQHLQRFVQSGADVNAFCSVPSQRFAVPMSPLQLTLVLCLAKSDLSHEIAVIKMLQDAHADSRALLHWHFAKRTLLSTNDRERGAVMAVILPPTSESTSPTLRVPLTAFGSDEHGWTLLMYLSLVGDNDRVDLLLQRIRSDYRESKTNSLLRYVEHVNGNGETALHIAIQASGDERQHLDRFESVALAIVACLLDCDVCISSASSLFRISNATDHTALHLAIKAKMWRLVNVLLEHSFCEPCTRDAFGNNGLHLLVKIGAPLNIFESMVHHFKTNLPEQDLNAYDQSANASPLHLAVYWWREDYVKILLAAGADPMDANQSHPRGLILSSDSVREPLLHAAIRRGLVDAAQGLMCDADARGIAVQPSALSLAVRYGLYRVAHDILEKLHPDEKEMWWHDAESGFPVVMLAAMAGQLELVAMMVDAGGDRLFTLQHESSCETLLHALVIFAVEHTHQNSKERRFIECPSPSNAMKDEDSTIDRQVVWQRSEELCGSEFASQAVEALLLQGLQTPDIRGVLTADCKRAITTTFRRDDFVNQIQACTYSVPSNDTYTLLSAISGYSHPSSFRLLALFLAAVRVHCDEADPPSTLIDVITARDRHTYGEMPVFAAMNRGHFDKALLLLHHLLPGIGNDDEDQDAIDESQHWMETNGTTLLHLACQHPTDEAALMSIDLLLRMNACTVLWDERGWCPLHTAICRGCDARAIQLFKKHDRELNVWSDAAHSMQMKERTVAIPLTPLMVAMVYNNAVAFRELVRCRAEWRMVTPTYRLGILQFAARCSITDPEMIEEVLELQTIQKSTLTDAGGMTSVEAIDILRTYLQARDTQLKDPQDVLQSSLPQSLDGETLLREDCVHEAKRENDEVRIALLGLQTPVGKPEKELPPISPSIHLTDFSHTPPLRSPSRSLSREPSREHRQTSSPPRHPQLEEYTLEFLRDEERATLTLIAQEARAEAHEWFKKRSGQKKLLSEARAQLQTIQSHRRTGSGTVVVTPEAAPPVTDAELLDTHKALAKKQFIDKHVASAVADAHATIERERRAIYQETGVFPGETVLSGRAKDSSLLRSSSTAGSGMHRSASINGSILMMSSRLTNISDFGTDSDRSGGEARRSADYGDAAFDDDGSFRGDRSASNTTWLSAGSADLVNSDGDGKEAVVNPLDYDEFVHVIETRRSMY